MALLTRLPHRASPRRTMRHRGSAMAGLIVVALSGAAAVAQDAKLSPEERAAVCGEAAERLKDWTADHPVAPDTHPVAIWKEVFCPEALTVTAGETVLFVNLEKRTSHSVWFRTDGRAESPRFFPDETFAQPVDLGTGDHDYVCGPHPWMRGRLTVEGGAK